MSMLSAQCDDLRKTADELQVFIDNAHNYTWSGFFSTLHYAQQELRGAADTIWELRNNLVGVVGQSDEIDRLKEQVRWLKKGDVLHVLTDQELADHQKHEREMHASIAALKDENAKLRELVAHLMYVKPNDVNAILHKGKLLRFDDLLAEVGMRWESEVNE